MRIEGNEYGLVFDPGSCPVSALSACSPCLLGLCPLTTVLSLIVRAYSVAFFLFVLPWLTHGN